MPVETGRHEPDGIAFGERSVDDADQADHAPVGVVVRIEHQGAQRRRRIPFRRREAVDDGFEQLVDAFPGLGRDPDRLIRRAAEHGGQLAGDSVWIGRRQIDLVDDRDDLEAFLDGEIGIGQRLGLDTLGGIGHQERSLARLETSGYLVREVDVARGVDEVQFVPRSRRMVEVDPHRVRLDRDPPLPLQVHVVEHLVAHLSLGDGAGAFQQAIGKRRFPMVDVGDDGEVTDARLVGHGWSPGRARTGAV